MPRALIRPLIALVSLAGALLLLLAAPATSSPAPCLPGEAVACENARLRSCPQFRPDKRYGDVAVRIRTVGTSCVRARALIAAFHDYDRDRGAYDPTVIQGFACRGSDGTPPVELVGRCTKHSQSVRWDFIPYTG